MDDTVIVVMLKNSDTGFLETEIGSYTVSDNENLIYNIFAIKEDGLTKAHMRLTVDRELEDWEYSAVYDYYDAEPLLAICESVTEDESGYNPLWEVAFKFNENATDMENKISEILQIHKAELNSVYDAVAEVKNEYE